MRIEVLSDNKYLFVPGIEALAVTSAKISGYQLNKAGEMRMSIPPRHPLYGSLHKLSTDIMVLVDGTEYFDGRILNDTVGWNNEKVIQIEGALAYFNDSIQRPFSFPVDEEHTTPADYFEFLIERHNEQVPENRKFEVGECTVTDPNNYIARSDSEYSTTWELLNSGLIDTLGGYLSIRYENGTRYIDYLADFDTLSSQEISFGINLLDIESDRRGEDVATAVLPLGAKNDDTDERLTISSVADYTTDDICKDGDIVYSIDAETQYGSRITKVVTWDDVTIAENLAQKAVTELGVMRQAANTITISAADLSAAGYDVGTFRLGNYIKVNDEPHSDAHGLQTLYLIKSIDVDLLNPGKSKLTVGATTYSLTEKNRQQLDSTAKEIESNVARTTSRAITDLEVRTQTELLQTETQIRSDVAERYYTKDAAADMMRELSTSISQTAEGLQIDFTNFQQSVDGQFELLQTYIRAEGGVVYIGDLSSPFTLQAENDRIGFFYNGIPISYWTPDEQITPKTLRIPLGGKLDLDRWELAPRASGNLSLTWIGGGV